MTTAGYVFDEAWHAERARLGSLEAALDPGTEPDFGSLFDALRDPLRSVVVAALGRLLEEMSGGMDCRYGRRLYPDLAAAGLVELRAEGRAHLIRGADDASGAAWLRLTVERVRDPLIAHGIDAALMDAALTLLDDPSFSVPSPLTLAVWGRRPA